MPTFVIENPTILRTVDVSTIPEGEERQAYKSLSARLQQTAALLTFLEAQAQIAPPPQGLEAVRREVERKVFDNVERLIRRNHPNLSDPFLKGV